MANLRIASLKIRSSSEIEVMFTHDLDSTIAIENVTIVGAAGGISNLTVLSVTVSGRVLTIAVRPMVPRAQYKLTLASTSTSIVRGSRGEGFIEDGSTNIVYFIGQTEENVIRDEILADLPGIYNTDADTIIFDTIDPSAKEIADTLHAIGEARSAFYVSVQETDEEITRGSGPFDRFNNEGVFQLIRVGSTITGGTESGTITFTAFPEDPISLRQVQVTDEVVSNTINDDNKFEGLLVTLAKTPVIKLISLTLVRGTTEYIYDISQFRYGVKESKFDGDSAYPALDIGSSQIRLSTSAVGPGFPLPQGSDKMIVTYLYAKPGRKIDASTVSVTTSTNITRESAPAVATTFSLKNAPIVNSQGVIPTIGGVQWLDPEANFNPSSKHPSFVTELQFNQSNLPKRPGEFTINYNTAQVIVFGEDGSGVDGTTTVPPTATYKYLKTYQEGLDFNFFSDLDEVASLPGRDLRNNPATVTFRFEDVFADGTDFDFSSHVEVINERVNNRLIENIGVETAQGPVTEVFRIFNETTGEIYTPTRVSGNQVYFSAVNLPATIDVIRESADFDQVIQSQIVVTDELTITAKPFIAFRIEMVNTDIVSKTGDFIGASFNSSVSFSDSDVFVKEWYYNPNDSLNDNLVRLQQVGDYMINYTAGVVYLAATSGSSTAIGDISYRYNKVKTRNTHIIRVDDIYRSTSVVLANTKTFTVGTVEDEVVEVVDLESAGFTTVLDSLGASVPILVVAGSPDTITVSKDVFRLRSIFQVTDLQTNTNPIDFSGGAVVSNSTQNVISLSSAGTLIDDSGLTVALAGSRKYIDADRLSIIFSAGLGELVSALSVSSGEVNYFTQGSDGYVDAISNRIYLPTSTGATVGETVTAKYRGRLIGGAAVLVDFSPGDIFINYTYSRDELLISYEYGDNILDWSISSTLREGDTYFVTYRYGALRNSLRDNFGVLTSVEELSTIPEELDRETYRHAVQGTLQSFLKGPTIPSIQGLGEAITQITPNIIESIFLEWILGRDHLQLKELELNAINSNELPVFSPGKFGNGLLFNKPGQTAILPANSNMRFNEGTWQTFVIPSWDGIDNDAYLTFDLMFDGNSDIDKIFIGSNNTKPTTLPFTIWKGDAFVFGRPSKLHQETGYFIWYDSTVAKWRVRTRAPIAENRLFSGTVGTSGQFYDVKIASTADGYDGYSGYEVNEINDVLKSTDESIRFAFIVDAYDSLNMAFDAYDEYGAAFAGFDGFDFTSDNLHYFFDTGFEAGRCRMSLFKDGKGFLRYRVYDENGRVKTLSTNISEWEANTTHHIAVSWKLATIEMRDEMHLFIDSVEVPNTYRFSGYVPVPPGVGAIYMDDATETLTASVTSPTIGGFDLSTTSGSDIVSSVGSNFNDVTIGSRFLITEDTVDGLSTQVTPFAYVRAKIGQNQLQLEVGPAGSAVPFLLTNTLSNVSFSVNPLTISTSADTSAEDIRVFAIDSYGAKTELFAPNSNTPEYEFSRDGYQDFVEIFNGISLGGSAILQVYGLNVARCKQLAYVWADNKTNILRTIMPAPTSVSKINVTALITRPIIIEAGVFAIIATTFGSHIIPLMVASLDHCQPSNSTTGRSMKVKVTGGNIDYAGINQVTLVGDTTDGYGSEALIFTENGSKITTRFFKTLTDVVASFTPLDVSQPVGVVEVREALPINKQENSGDFAQIRLSVQKQSGIDGYATGGTGELFDGYSRFGASDIGRTVNISSPAAIAGTYTVSDVPLDPSSTVKDSQTAILNTTWADSYSNVEWKLLTTSFVDSGFANGLITLEIAQSGGMPYLLRSCWYEVDFPTYLVVPWTRIPEDLYIGSDLNGMNQANAVIDELRILDELSNDTRRGETTPSSGRSITTDALVFNEFSDTTQTLGLFHFNDSVENSASFSTSYEKTFRQSANSVNSSFGQSIVFNQKKSLEIDNKSIFQNNEGTIEFWVSPILDTYNDPTIRYYIDLSPKRVVTAEVAGLTVTLPIRARSVSEVTVSGLDTNFFIGGRLSASGLTITLGQPVPGKVEEVSVTLVPITSQGDRFSVFKNEVGQLVLLVTARGIDFQITTPVFWKKNTWHRVLTGWDLNNDDNQDRLIMLVDGSEGGIIRYGTGLRYGTGSVYGQPTIWGSAQAGTVAARNLLTDINLEDNFNKIHVGADFTGQFTAMARMDNIRFSSALRPVTFLGGQGPGKLLGKDLLFAENTNAAQPVISDALTRLLLDFDTERTEVENIATVRDNAVGIFDFFVEIIDTFELADTDLVHDLITKLVDRIKPAHTRAFVSFTK